ncbi:protein FAM151A-like isoform X2 [Ptychodera flava]|uniref:protein FAM151A-like isoform X2 n=1 Tax=Ptychodera flava TaxID=63121 RepID=UPI00396AAAED
MLTKPGMSHMNKETYASTNTMDNILDFYPAAEGDGLKIVWAHAVNSEADLTTALADDTMMLEADISPEEGTGTPIMAHPPDLTSDITLSEWINRTTETNKGMKLDIKYLEVLSDALSVVNEYDSKIHQPLWYNADIVPGPNSPKTPVEPVEFISTINEVYPGAVLSLGWTTFWEGNAPEQLYTWTMVFHNLNYSYPCQQAVTFPVRAVWAASSWDKWVWLLGLRDDFSITVWSSSNDDVDIDGLVEFRLNGDMKRIYYDIPESQMQDFNEALKNVPEETVGSNDQQGWDKSKWKSVESTAAGNYVYLSTHGVGLVGESRASYIQTKDQYKLNTGDLGEVEISGKIQFVFRPDQDVFVDGDGVEIYIRTSEVDNVNSIDRGVSLYIGRDGKVILQTVSQTEVRDDVVSGQLGPSDCYSFDINDEGGEGDVTAEVKPVSCFDGTGTLPPDTKPLSLSLESPPEGNRFYVAVTKTGGNVDALLEDLTLRYSAAVFTVSSTALLVAAVVVVLETLPV